MCVWVVCIVFSMCMIEVCAFVHQFLSLSLFLLRRWKSSTTKTIVTTRGARFRHPRNPPAAEDIREVVFPGTSHHNTNNMEVVGDIVGEEEEEVMEEIDFSLNISNRTKATITEVEVEIEVVEEEIWEEENEIWGEEEEIGVWEEVGLEAGEVEHPETEGEIEEIEGQIGGHWHHPLEFSKIRDLSDNMWT